MNILTLDTSSNLLRTGLQTSNGWLENLRSTGLKHGEKLIPSVQSLIAEAGLEPKDLDLIVCTRGPGSFTGLRIGLSTAKGLSEGSGAPLVMISSLGVYGKLYSSFPGTVVPLFDAKKNRFYTCFYCGGEALEDELDVSAETILDRALKLGNVLFTGPGLEIFIERLPCLHNFPDFSFDFHDKVSLCNVLSEMGKEKFAREGAALPEAGPRYLRASDAELGRKVE